MKNLTVTFILFFTVLQFAHSQENVGIGTLTPDSSAILDIVSTDKGILIPRIDTNAVATPIAGLLIYQPSDNKFYYHNGSLWTPILKGADLKLSAIADTDGDTKIQTEESADEDIIRMDLAGNEVLRIEKNAGAYTQFNTPNSRTSVLIGTDAGDQLTGGSANVMIGENAGESLGNTQQNVIIGANAAKDATMGINSVIIGSSAAQFSDNIDRNTIIGRAAAQFANQTINSVIIGEEAGKSITNSGSNIIIGDQAGSNFDAAQFNIAIGSFANRTESGGDKNVVVGYQAGHSNSGNQNVLIGEASGRKNTGNKNVFLGYQAGHANTTGYDNIAIGSETGSEGERGTNNIFMGRSAGRQDTSSFNIMIGDSAGNKTSTGDGNIFIGDQAARSGAKGARNIVIGQDAGSASRIEFGNVLLGGNAANNLDTLSNNVIIGDDAAYGYNSFSGTMSDNVIIGKSAANRMGSMSDDNTIIGSYAANNIREAYRNTIIGKDAANELVAGNDNIAIGSNTLFANTDGHENVVIGTNALANLVENSSFEQHNNTVVGYGAGQFINGDRNIALGHRAGYNSDDSDDNIYIGNNSGFKTLNSNTPLGSDNIFIGNQTTYSSINNNISNSIVIGGGRLLTQSNSVLLGDSVWINSIGQVSISDPTNGDHAVTLSYMENNLPIHPHSISDEAPGSMTIAACATYCRDLVEDGFEDWGLPSLPQASYFIGITTSTNSIWTSTLHSGATQYAWKDAILSDSFTSPKSPSSRNSLLNLSNGGLFSTSVFDVLRHCRCVR